MNEKRPILSQILQLRPMSKEFPKPGGLEKTPKKLTNSFTNVSDVAKLLGPMVTKKINNSIDFLRHADETRFSNFS